jgi:riboflavin synthase alpha subunit
MTDRQVRSATVTTILGLTTWGHRRVGGLNNLEVDVIAQYVEWLLTHPARDMQLNA